MAAAVEFPPPPEARTVCVPDGVISKASTALLYPSPTITWPLGPTTNVPLKGELPPSHPADVLLLGKCMMPIWTAGPVTTMGGGCVAAIAFEAPRQRVRATNRATPVPATRDRTGLVNLLKVICIPSPPICFHPRSG